MEYTRGMRSQHHDCGAGRRLKEAKAIDRDQKLHGSPLEPWCSSLGQDFFTKSYREKRADTKQSPMKVALHVASGVACAQVIIVRRRTVPQI